MRKIISLTHLSLDGVMQSPGGPEEDPRNGFDLGGWSMRFGDEIFGQVLQEIMSRKFDLLLGRRTYEIFSAYWPYSSETMIADVFNQATKWVATRTLSTLDWQNSKRLEGDVVEAVRQLKQSDGPELHIWGSGHLLQTLIAADLIDEFYLFTYPVILGKGQRLFEHRLPPRNLELIKSQSDSTGSIISHYRPAGLLPAPNRVVEIPSEAELARRKKWTNEAKED